MSRRIRIHAIGTGPESRTKHIYRSLLWHPLSICLLYLKSFQAGIRVPCGLVGTFLERMPPKLQKIYTHPPPAPWPAARALFLPPPQEPHGDSLVRSPQGDKLIAEADHTVLGPLALLHHRWAIRIVPKLQGFEVSPIWFVFSRQAKGRREVFLAAVCFPAGVQPCSSPLASRLSFPMPQT